VEDLRRGEPKADERESHQSERDPEPGRTIVPVMIEAEASTMPICSAAEASS